MACQDRRSASGSIASRQFSYPGTRKGRGDWIRISDPLCPRQNFRVFQGSPTRTTRCHTREYFLAIQTISAVQRSPTHATLSLSLGDLYVTYSGLPVPRRIGDCRCRCTTSRINDRRTSSALESERQRDYRDDALRGFGVRVPNGGKRAFVVRYRVGRRLRRLTIAPYPAKSLCRRAQGSAVDPRPGR